jgi:ferredoxin-NADP reductase
VRAARHRLRVAEVIHEGHDVVSVVVTGRRLDRLRFEPGQFMIWRFLTPGRWWQAHPFSLSRAPDGQTLRITAKGVGRYSRGLADLRPGTRVLAEGPFGTFTLATRRARRLLLIAGGIGITPIRAMLESLPAGCADTTLVHRVMTDDDRVLDAELVPLAAQRNVELEILPGDHRHPAAAQHLSPAHLAALIPAPRDTDVFICGPPAMTDAVRRSVRAAGVPSHLIHTERFAL